MALLKYEVVVLFDATNSQEKIDSAKKEVDSLIENFGGKVLERDDIGYLETLYKIGSSLNPYFYSILVELDGEQNKEFKRKLGIMSTVVRYKVLKMSNNQKFLKFKDLEKELWNVDFSNVSKSGIFHEIKS